MANSYESSDTADTAKKAAGGWGVNVNDSGYATATAGNQIGGITFGSAGSGRHTTGAGAGSIPPWLIAVGVVAVVVVMTSRRRGRK